MRRFIAECDQSWAIHSLMIDQCGPLLISSVLALGLASVMYPLVHRTRELLGIEANTCICIRESRDLVQQTSGGGWVVQRTRLALSMDEIESCQDFYAGVALGVSVHSVIDRLHQISAFALGFARGLNDTPKALALLVTVGWAQLDPKI